MNISKEEIPIWMSSMIIPVVDIKDNECVSGKSGKRDTYKKLKSVYGDSPVEIARNLRKSGYELLYVADLDKLEGTGDNSPLISQINEIIPVLLDNAIKDIDDIEKNRNVSTYDIIATESIGNMNEIYRIIDEYPNEKLFLSIDIKDDRLLIDNPKINLDDIIDLINHSKIKYVIILNISRVGTKTSAKSSIGEYLLNNTSGVEFIMAGGITNESIMQYQKEGINCFLVGSILHEKV